VHNLFKDLIAQVSNADILYRALNFYLQFSPLELNEVLGVIGHKIDAMRVIDLFRRSNNLQLIKSWLASVQSDNSQGVNEALNALYIEDGDYEALRHSIDSFDLFDGISLARSLERHECLEFRRIASYLYRRASRWTEAIDLSKIDKLYGDCIETASQSRSPDVVEPLLRWFVSEELFECFGAATFVCYDLVSSDLILELAWRNKCIDFAMPYLIQSMREQNAAIAKINAQLEEMGGKVDETKQIAQQAASLSAAPPGFAPSTPFPVMDGGFNPNFGDPNAGFAPQFPDQGQFAGSVGGFPAPADAFGRQGQFPASAGGFPAFNQPPQMPPF
jgi:clathrin heavy chain